VSRSTLAFVLLATALAHSLNGASGPELDEATRHFYEDGPALLVDAAERTRLATASAEDRATFAREFLTRDPGPQTPANELLQAIERRQREVLAAGYSLFDARGQLYFLRGAPTRRAKVECPETYRPLEIWTWGSDKTAPYALLVQPAVGAHFVAWRPTDSKRALFTPEMEYLLEQWDELRIRRKRPDQILCKQADEVDRLTGIDGLFGFHKDRLRDTDVEALFAPPAEPAAWAQQVLAAAPAPGTELPQPAVRVSFPERVDQRLKVRLRLELPAGTQLGVTDADSGKESRLALKGVIEQPGGVFEEFQIRYVFQPVAATSPVVLLADRALRPGERFVARLELRDEIGGAQVDFERGFEVPREPVPEPEQEAAAGVAGQELGLARTSGRDTLVLLPPVDDVVFGLWRAEAIVAGDRIRKVVFYLDGKPQLTRTAAPWSAELRLPSVPQETIVRAEGQDADGKVIAADEVLLNEPQGEPRVKLLAPPRGRKVSGSVVARAAVVAPEGKRVAKVVFKLNDQQVAELTQPPWETTIDVPASGDLTYLTVVATYSDGSEVEDFRVLNSNDFVAEIRVDLVELYVTVTDRQGRLVEGLQQKDFEILDNGKPQAIERFELVTDLPLTLGLVLDTSGSMRESLGEAKRAAQDFLAAVMTPRDRCFAVGFSERPSLLMPLTPDAKALETAFRDLPALGNTSLHDALVYSLYQYRGIRGRKAMVLLSDGDDTSSLVRFEDALAFAQRSGVAIYTIGLGIGRANLGIRAKLEKLAEETGGRTFFIGKAEELAGVYGSIERELRSQYFLAFSPSPPPKEGERHNLDVRVAGGKWKARTARGYTP